MNKRLLFALAALVGAWGCGDGGATGPLEAPVFFAQGGAAGSTFGTHLTGAAEVPPNDSKAQGQATFQLSDDGDEIQFRLVVANIQNVTQAHIHLGAPTATGGIVVWLYPSAPPQLLIPGRSSGVLGEGTITEDDLVGALADDTLDDLIEEIRAGNAYVNVHTTQFGAGEIRGQLP